MSAFDISRDIDTESKFMMAEMTIRVIISASVHCTDISGQGQFISSAPVNSLELFIIYFKHFVPDYHIDAMRWWDSCR